jgi:hypothetical protein
VSPLMDELFAWTRLRSLAGTLLRLQES